MEKTVFYYGVEKIVYRINEAEIKDVLIRNYDVHPQNGDVIEFEIIENDNGKHDAWITVKRPKEIKEPK
jgi:hypothetical protein